MAKIGSNSGRTERSAAGRNLHGKGATTRKMAASVLTQTKHTGRGAALPADFDSRLDAAHARIDSVLRRLG